MNIHYCQNYYQLSQLAASIVIEAVARKPDSLLCAATGNSPTGLYDRLALDHHKNPGMFNQLRVIKLDEWGGISMNNPISCEAYLQKHIIGPLQISKDRYFAFHSSPESTVNECKRIQNEIENYGPIDICILGIGTNGHIGLNEPAPALVAHCHEASLTDHTLQHQMIQSAIDKPRFGLTLGMKNILESKIILLLITGSHKQKVTRQLLTQEITTQLPASFLWLHSQVTCIIDKNIS